MTIDADAQDASRLTLAAARAEFDADVTYLDTATFGLPPRRSWAALQQALAQWRAGTADAVPMTCRSLRLGPHMLTWPTWIHPW